MKQDAFQSAFAGHLEDFIEHKRAIGCRYTVGAGVLKRFDRFCIREHGSEEVLSKELVTHWAQRRPGESIGTLAFVSVLFGNSRATCTHSDTMRM